MEERWLEKPEITGRELRIKDLALRLVTTIGITESMFRLSGMERKVGRVQMYEGDGVPDWLAVNIAWVTGAAPQGTHP